MRRLYQRLINRICAELERVLRGLIADDETSAYCAAADLELNETDEGVRLDREDGRKAEPVQVTQPIVFMDTETTGVHPKREVWEVAMIRRDDDGEQERSFFIRDVDLSKADPFGLAVGRFYERHPDYAHQDLYQSSHREWNGGAIDPSKAAGLVERWTRGALIVGAVPNFDTECLDRLLRRHGLIPAWHYHLIDVEALAVGYLAAQGRADWLGRKWDSDLLSLECGVKPAADDERHTAMGDVRWAMRLYDAIANKPTVEVKP